MQENRKEFDNTEHTLVIEGRNAVLEAFRSGKPIDKVFVAGRMSGRTGAHHCEEKRKSMIRSSILWEKSDFHRFP